MKMSLFSCILAIGFVFISNLSLADQDETDDSTGNDTQSLSGEQCLVSNDRPLEGWHSSRFEIGSRRYRNPRRHQKIISFRYPH
jgi:hypothetical protein